MGLFGALVTLHKDLSVSENLGFTTVRAKMALALVI
jgi:hypothetical protein